MVVHTRDGTTKRENAMNTTITRQQLQQAEDFLEKFEIYNAVRTNYSGRGMYGKECVGFVVGYSEVGLAGLAIAYAFDGDLMEAAEILQNASTDSMGFDTIVYFRGLSVDDTE